MLFVIPICPLQRMPFHCGKHRSLTQSIALLIPCAGIEVFPWRSEYSWACAKIVAWPSAFESSALSWPPSRRSREGLPPTASAYCRIGNGMGSLQLGPFHFLLPYWGGACARLAREIRQPSITGIHVKNLRNIAGFRSAANAGKCDIPKRFFEIDAFPRL